MKPTMINVLKTKFKMSPVKNEECLKNNKTNMISLGKELKNILMCKPCVKGVQHLGIHLRRLFIMLLIIIYNLPWF